ncbi:MAG: Mur ligase family protein, partial [Bacteroidota bacterium]
MSIRVEDLERIPHREFPGRREIKRRSFTGVSTDSRTVREGELFVALRGERHDGHRFLCDAFVRGAAAAVIRRGAWSGEAPGPLLVVEDTLDALGELARLHRRRFRIPVLAVAGSNGKTTTKEMIARVLGRRWKVLSTEGNLNNRIGLPQTLFGLDAKHEAAVVELGTNHPGEIEFLCRIAEPTHGLITTIGKEHLEFLGDLAGVAAEEGALFAWLRGLTHGTAFVHADEKAIASRSRGIARRWTYGFGARSRDV